ncbi:MAG: PEP-CTERM sorting domain-containing protein, partial [Planctomycetota bacterium]
PAGEVGYNFGWRPREGYIATPTGGVGGPKPTDNADPIFDYAHDSDSAAAGTPGTGLRPVLGRSITGGYVYRGEDLGPNFQGKYIFGDFVSGRVFALDVAGAADLDSLGDFSNLEDIDLPVEDITSFVFPFGAPQFQLASFGEDADGELYVATFNGNVTRIDFNKTGGDADFDLDVDLADFGILRANFGRTDNPRFQDGDFNEDDLVDLADFGILRANFGTSSPGDLALLDAWYATVVPEPTTASLLAIGGAILLRRRHR